MGKKCMLLYLHLSLSHILLSEAPLPAIIKHLFIIMTEQVLPYGETIYNCCASWFTLKHLASRQVFGII